jgi:hypothetical protein
MLCVVLRVQTFGGGLLRGVDHCRGSSGAAPCPVLLSGLGAAAGCLSLSTTSIGFIVTRLD